MEEAEPAEPAEDVVDAVDVVADIQPAKQPAPGQGPVPYRHDPALVPVLAQLADSACEGVEDLHEVNLRVRPLAATLMPPLDPAAVRELTDTFTYIMSVNPSGSAQPGASLEPLDGPSIFPRALREADDDVRALWAALADVVTHPIARARCSDIVFTLRMATNNRDAAERAARRYLGIVGGSLRPREQCHGLLRAWTLARSVSLTDLEQEIVSAMLDMADDVLTRQDDPYAAIPLLEALTAPQRRSSGQQVDPRVDDLLDRALLAYPEVHVIKDVAALVRKSAAGDGVRIERANRIEIEAILTEADKATDGLVARFHLNEAASTARRLKMPDLEDVAVSRLQSAPTVEWETTRTETKLPVVLIDSYMRPFDRTQNWCEALGVWCCTDSPSGRLSNNEATVQKLQEVSVFRRLATTVVFGRDDLPKRVLPDDDNAFKHHELVRVESANFSLNGLLLANALDSIKAHFGIPSQDDLETFIASSGTHSALARALAKALQLYWVGEYEASVHLAVPKIEAAARALLLELNAPLYRAAVGDTTGQFPGLGALLPYLLDNEFDPDWERFLRAFLLSEGANVRNFIAHGSMDNVDRTTAALALRACALLVLITSNDAAQRDTTAVKATLATPHGTQSHRSWWQRIIGAIRAACFELRR